MECLGTANKCVAKTGLDISRKVILSSKTNQGQGDKTPSVDTSISSAFWTDAEIQNSLKYCKTVDSALYNS